MTCFGAELALYDAYTQSADMPQSLTPDRIQLS